MSFQHRFEFCILVIPKIEKLEDWKHVIENIISFPHDEQMEGLKNKATIGQSLYTTEQRHRELFISVFTGQK